MVLLGRFRLKAMKQLDDLRATDALKIGFFQALALIPGTSRSGITIIGGRVSGLDYEQAAEYSFLIAMPVIFGAVIAEVTAGSPAGSVQPGPAAIAVGIIASFTSGMLAVAYLLRYLKRHGLAGFGAYRIFLGLIILSLI